MSIQDERQRQLLQSAIARFNKGNSAQAELLCREYLELAPGDPTAYTLLGDIAARIGARSFAHDYYKRALKSDPGFAQARQNRMRILADPVTREGEASGRTKYLLIKSWGFGFWSDVDHVLGQLLIAELTGRRPVVHWGINSLFRSEQCANAFNLYFEPIADISIHDLAGSALSYFPPKWHGRNLLEEDLNKWSGYCSRMAGFITLFQHEDVVVSDFHTPLYNLTPWISESSEYFGMSPEEIYRLLFGKYLILQSGLRERIEGFWSRNMEGRRWLGVHIRNSDKELELQNLQQLNNDCEEVVEATMQSDRNLSLFLLTDCSVTHERYRKKYGARMLSTDSIRVNGNVGIHCSGFPGQRVAEEVILDAFLAAKCDFFLGNGFSNVSTTVQHLKRWPEGTYRLLGENCLFKRNLVLHDW